AILVFALAAQPPDAAVSTQEPSQPPAPQPAPQRSDEPDSKKPPTPAHTGIRALFGNLAGDYTHLAHKDNFYVARIGGGLAAAAPPFDADFNVRLRSHYTTVNRAFAPAKYFGNTPEQVGLSLGTYAVGRLIKSDKTSHLGMDLLRAQILTESMVEP